MKAGTPHLVAGKAPWQTAHYVCRLARCACRSSSQKVLRYFLGALYARASFPQGGSRGNKKANRLSFPQRRKPRLARSTSVMRHTLTDNAQRLRREMTAEERKLWYCFLCRLSVPFNRQKVIGQYIVDFYCAQAQIAVEVDGSQHYEEQGSSMDVQRDAFLAKRGIAVLRYSNREVNEQFQEVCNDIANQLSGKGLSVTYVK